MLVRTSSRTPMAALMAGALAAGVLTVTAPPAHAGPEAAALVAPAAVAGPGQGTVLGRIRIPRIGLKARVLQGVSERVLRRGAGHYPGTDYPGREGNTVLLGHRTTWLHPFNRINELRRGDPIVLTIGGTSYTYRMRERRIIMPSDRRALEAVPFKRESVPDGEYVTLISCHPKGSNRRRIVVVGARENPERAH
ncbi:class E sortase [Actinomadura roseirufa]|uniref:class E sortase n=1 Tax=Actinomadura roseirufa TaxID=2094049 RepID=UPI00104147C4|nr:class E sortase [Actinomadura roseirufa]